MLRTAFAEIVYMNDPERLLARSVDAAATPRFSDLNCPKV